MKKFIRIGHGPESLLRQSSGLAAEARSDMYFGKDVDGDAIEAHQWKCVRTINGILILNLKVYLTDRTKTQINGRLS